MADPVERIKELFLGLRRLSGENEAASARHEVAGVVQRIQASKDDRLLSAEGATRRGEDLCSYGLAQWLTCHAFSALSMTPFEAGSTFGSTAVTSSRL